MAETYVKEFEKWLQGSNQKRKCEDDQDSVDMEESGDEVDNHQATSLEGNSLTLSGHYFQDEPPILEPVHYSSCTTVPGITITPNEENQNIKKVFCGIYGLSHLKTNGEEEKEILKDKFKTHLESEKISSLKPRESENIFDKFSLLPDGDDLPPPLIPSHEAHLTTVDVNDEDSAGEKSYATLQNLSPNFCAMEADSTSEMFKTDFSDTVFTSKDSKTIESSDFGVECDSTCMFGTSPHVVSPGSVSNVESDNLNQEESTVFLDENLTVSWSGVLSKERPNTLPPLCYARRQSLNAEAGNNFFSKQGTSDKLDSNWDRECPKLEAVMDITESETKENYQHKKAIDVEDPPVLSLVPPSPLKSRGILARRKRHTIDSVHSVKKSKQKSCHGDSSKNSKITDLHISPSTSSMHTELSRESSTKLDNDSFSSTKKEMDTFCSYSRFHSRSRKHHRKRCQTFQIVDLITYGSHLSRDLNDFVIESSELCNLQNRMHQLLSLLFPQLSPELLLMSPESSRFNILLNDLFLSLQDKESESNENSRFNVSLQPNSHKEPKHDKRDRKCTSGQSKPPDSSKAVSISSCKDANSKLFPAENESNCTSELKERGLCSLSEMDPYSQHSEIQSADHSEKLESTVNDKHGLSESLLPELSKLTLTKEKERVLKRQPSVVIPKNPSAVRKSFFKLSCSILQRLLPELNVSLSKEFVDSPNDLLHFIDSVIDSNSLTL